MNEEELTKEGQKARDEILDYLIEGKLNKAISSYMKASGKTHEKASSIIGRLADILEKPGNDKDEEDFLTEFRASLNANQATQNIQAEKIRDTQSVPPSSLDISKLPPLDSSENPEPAISQVSDLPIELQEWLNPGFPLKEPARFIPTGFTRPYSTIPFLLGLLFVFWLIFVVSVKTWDQLAIAGLIGLPLFIFGLRTVKPYWNGTRARRSIRQGFWRQGVYLLDNNLLYYDGNSVKCVPRKNCGTLRTPEFTEQHNRERYRGSTKNRKLKADAGPKLSPAIQYDDPVNGSQSLNIPIKSSEWWQHLEAIWDTWKQTGRVKPRLLAGSIMARISRWIPILVYLHLLYLMILLVAALLGINLQQYYGYSAFSILGLGALSSLLLFFLATKSNAIFHFLWNEVPNKLTFKRGGAYLILLCVFAFVGSINVVMKASAWYYSVSAERLPYATIADIGSYQGINVIMGLKDGKIQRSAGYGTYQSYQYNTASKQYERGAMHYVARMISVEEPSICIYLGASDINGVSLTSAALKRLKLAPFYREPSPYGQSDPDSYGKAIMDLEGARPQCQMIVVEAVPDPDALIAQEWQIFLLLMLLFNLLPIFVLSVWKWFKFERDWLWDSTHISGHSSS